jgi:hypothetical protein
VQSSIQARLNMDLRASLILPKSLKNFTLQNWNDKLEAKRAKDFAQPAKWADHIELKIYHLSFFRSESIISLSRITRNQSSPMTTSCTAPVHLSRASSRLILWSSQLNTGYGSCPPLSRRCVSICVHCPFSLSEKEMSTCVSMRKSLG